MTVRFVLVLLLGCISVATTGIADAHAQGNRVIVDLGAASDAAVSEALDINASGIAVGVIREADEMNHSVVWTDGSVAELPELEGALGSVATAINDAGQIAGFVIVDDESYFGVVWQDGAIAYELPGLPGIMKSRADGINEAGQVVGAVADSNGDFQAAMWEEETMTLLQKPANAIGSAATAINDRGEAVGFAWGADDTNYAVAWDSGGVRELPRLPGGTYSRADAINNSGVIAGAAEDSDDRFAVLWEGGSVTLLGLPEDSHASDVNDGGVVVGWVDDQPFVLEGGTVTHLALLPVAPTAWPGP